MAGELAGRRIAFLTANEGVERVELTEPRKAVEEAGAAVELLAPEADDIQTFNHLDKAEKYRADRAVGDASASDYDGLVLPGGVANPDHLRLDQDAVRFVAGLLRVRKAGRGDLPRAVDPDRGGRRPWPAPDLVAEPARPTSATPAATGSTRRSWSTTAS